MADYTLAQKLNIHPDAILVVINGPEDYLKMLNIKNKISHSLLTNSPFIHYFAQSKKELEKDFPKLRDHLAKNGSLWISNKKGGPDFNQADVQKIGLKNGLVDIKIASLNEVWSAMKFVYRLEKR